MHALKRLFSPGRTVALLLLAAAFAVAFGMISPSVPGNLPAVQTPADSDRPGSDPHTPEKNFVLPVIGAKTPRKAMSQGDLMRLSAQIPFSPDGQYTPGELAAAGFFRSAETYDSAHSILVRRRDISLPDAYGAGMESYSVLHYVRPDEMSAPEPIYELLERQRLAVEPYMGYLLVSDGTTMRILDAEGKVLITAGQGELVPMNTRDAEGHPLFFGSGAVGMRNFYIDEKGTLQLSDYDDTVEGRGLYFDYAPSFGVSDNSLIRLLQRELVTLEKLDGTKEESVRDVWAYGYSATRRRTGYNFSGAFDFSDGMAAVLDADGFLNYIGESGYYAFYPRKNYYYYDRYVTEYFLPPLTDGEESIGFYYYDHGLVRVRRQVVDWYGITYIDTLRVAVDEDILIDKTGKEFPVPEGYDIVSYSDGVILLTKDGKYGYMDYTGKWIAQPIYDHARPFFEGLAVAGFADGTRLMLDTAGEIVIPAGRYTHISDASTGVVAAYSPANGWEVYHKMAKIEG